MDHKNIHPPFDCEICNNFATKIKIHVASAHKVELTNQSTLQVLMTNQDQGKDNNIEKYCENKAGNEKVLEVVTFPNNQTDVITDNKLGLEGKQSNNSDSKLNSNSELDSLDMTGYKCDNCGKSFENWNDHIKICSFMENSFKQKQQEEQKMKHFHVINDENKENGEAKDDSATYINIDLNNIKNEPLDVIDTSASTDKNLLDVKDFVEVIMGNSGQKIFQCNICNQYFSPRFDLDVHIKLQHLNEKNFPCDLCNYVCGQKPDLKKHKLKYHTRWIEGEYPPMNTNSIPSPRASPNDSLPYDHSSPIKSNKRSSPEPNIMVDANPNPPKKFCGISPEKEPNCPMLSKEAIPIMPMGPNCPILCKEMTSNLPITSIKREKKNILHM